MADGSDDPGDLVSYFRLIEAGYDCAFGSRFIRGAQTRNYPKTKLVLNRIANLIIRLLFGHGYNDTTNAFKAYRREVIETVQPLVSNHFNLTVEILCRRSNQLDEPRYRPIEAPASGDGKPVSVHRLLRVSRAAPQPR
jgi:hypothetical protein